MYFFIYVCISLGRYLFLYAFVYWFLYVVLDLFL